MRDAENPPMRLPQLLLSGLLLAVPLAAQAAPQEKAQKKADFSLVSVPLGKKDRCSPIFFCRTSPPTTSKAPPQGKKARKPFTKQRQVNWCYKYAATILGKKIAPKQLLLVQIDPSVNLTRLKELASVLARESKCQGAWPAKKIQPAASSSSLVAEKITRERKVASGLSISSEVETLADPGSVEQRGVVVLKPGDEYTNPEVAAMIGPPYASRTGDYVASIDSIPTEEVCACSSLDLDELSE